MVRDLPVLHGHALLFVIAVCRVHPVRIACVSASDRCADHIAQRNHAALAVTIPCLPDGDGVASPNRFALRQPIIHVDVRGRVADAVP